MPTLNLRVGASTDDVNQESIATNSGRAVATGAVQPVDLTLTLLSPGSHGTGNSEWSVGARFPSVTIPQGATITSALFGMTPQTTYSTAAAIGYLVSAQAADNAATFATGTNLHAATRPRTTAVSAVWNQQSVVVDVEATIDVTSVVQEIVNRAGWASGNAIAMLVDTNIATADSEWQDYYSWDGAPTKAPTLVITYSSGGVTGTASITQGANTVSAAGAVKVSGSAAITQAAQTDTAAGTVKVSGSAAITQAANTLTGVGGSANHGAANLTQDPQTLVAAGTVKVTGAATNTQGAHTLTAAGTVASAGINGSASLSQDPHTVTAVGAVRVTGSASNTQGANTLSAAGGQPLPYKTNEVSAGFGYADVSPKQLVRTSGDRLYIVTVNCDSYPGDGTSNQLMVKKANQTGLASGFTEQDVAHRPTGGIAQWAAAIDNAGIIHIIYAVRSTSGGNITDIRYITYNTATDLYGTAVSIDNTVNFSEDGGSQGNESLSIAVDASGFPHIVYLGSVSAVRRMRYSNRTTGAWSAAVTIDDQTLTSNFKIWRPNLVFDTTGRLIFAWHSGTFNDTADGRVYTRTRETNGTLNTTVAVSAANGALTGIDNSSSMMVTADNRYHIVWMNGSTTNSQKYIRYAYSDDLGASWTRNDPASGLQATHNPSLGPDGKGGVRIYGHGTPDVSNHGINMYYFEGKGGAATWSSWTLWVTNSSIDSSLNARWSQYHHYKPGTLDTMYWNDNYPNVLFYAGELVAQGAAAITQDPQTLTATGLNASPRIGSAAMTQAAQTMASAGTVKVTGGGSNTQGGHTLTAAGTTIGLISGIANLTQAPQLLSAAGLVKVSGQAVPVQDPQTIVAAGAVKVVGVVAALQTEQTLTALGGVKVSGVASNAQGANVILAAGSAIAGGIANLLQAPNTLSASGFVVTFGILPPGLSLNPSTGAITGTPTTRGTYTFTITATDSTSPGSTVSRTYSITVS